MNNKENNNRVPQLRFPGFTGEWVERRLVDSFEERIEKDRGDLPLLSLGEEGLTLQSETQRKDNSNSDKSKYLRVAIGDVAYNTMRMWQGRCVYCNIEGIVSPAYTVCKPKDGIDPLFHYYLFKTAQMINIFHQNSQGLVNDTLNLKYEAFSKIKYLLPTLAEQQKIAECLSSLDEEIAAEAQKADALKDHKKGLMQQLFPAISNEQLAMSNCVPKLRFPGFTGEWVVKNLGEVFTRITRKNNEDNRNVLTISAQYGLVSQTDFFNKSVAAADVTGYYLLERGNFAYNKSSSSGNPMGVIKPLKKYEKGVVSTLYICFSCNEPKSISFWEQYFNAGCLDSEIRTIAQEGARNHGLLNVPTSDFFTLKVLVPTLAEQQKIADCLSELDEMISAQQQKVEALKEHKKGLMQKLFPKM